MTVQINGKDVYRIEEREHEKFPFDRSRVGKYVYVNRIIKRCGYAISPTDCPDEYLKVAAHRYFVGNFKNLTSTQLDYNHSYPSNSDLEVTDDDRELIHRICQVANIPERRLLQGVYYILRNRWFKEQPLSKELHHLRTFWYADYERPIELYISRCVTKQIGIHHEATSYHGYEYDDYDPAYLSVWTYQTVYQSELYGTVFIHPLDIL